MSLTYLKCDLNDLFNNHYSVFKTVMIEDLCWHHKSITITVSVLFIDKLWPKNCNLQFIKFLIKLNIYECALCQSLYDHWSQCLVGLPAITLLPQVWDKKLPQGHH